MDGDTLTGRGDVYAQMVFILKKIEKMLLAAGATLQDVVRTRMFVTDIGQWKAIDKAHALFFFNRTRGHHGGGRPADKWWLIGGDWGDGDFPQ